MLKIFLPFVILIFTSLSFFLVHLISFLSHFAPVLYSMLGPGVTRLCAWYFYHGVVLGYVFPPPIVLFCIICLLMKYCTPPTFLIGWHHATETFHCPHSSLYKPNIGSAGFLLDSQPLKMEPIGCPETSVRNYQYSLPNKLEGRSSHLLHGRSLKSRLN